MVMNIKGIEFKPPEKIEIALEKMSAGMKNSIRWLVGAIIVAIISFYSGILNEHYQGQSNFTKSVKMDVSNLRYQDEYTNIFCEQQKNLIHNQVYFSELFLINMRRNDAFSKLVQESEVNKNLFSKISYSTIKNFARYNNKLFYAGINVCNMSLKNELDLRKIQDKINEKYDKW